MDEEGIRAIQITDKESNWQIAKDISSSFIGTLSGDMFAFGMGLVLLDEDPSSLEFWDRYDDHSNCGNFLLDPSREYC